MRSVADTQKKRDELASKIDIDYPLQKVFGKTSFRAPQREIIRAALAGKDIYVQAATSFGKSLCFQLPAWCSTGVTVVISPLLALVHNQVVAANTVGIVTETLNSDTPFTVKARIETDLQCGHPRTRLLYVTPEKCATDSFKMILRRMHQQGQLVRIAIDEAHCISEWGHDFRTAYKELSWLKSNLQVPSVPIMALTATATEKVRQDIYRYLKLKPDQTLFFSTSSARPNIHYELQYFSESNPQDSSGDDIFPYLLALLSSMHDRRVAILKAIRATSSTNSIPIIPVVSGIIYMNSRAGTEALAMKLQNVGINASAYHAGLENLDRLRIQNQFLKVSSMESVGTAGTDPFDLSQGLNVITATNAFGMGIDMPSIRFVIHHGLPRNVESFVQESGRAGRDGKAALSLVLYTREERDRAIFRARKDALKEQKPTTTGAQPGQHLQHKMKSLEKVIEYCEGTNTCRHKVISDYFGYNAEVRGAARSVSMTSSEVECDHACDVCKEGSVAVRRRHDRGLASDEEASQFTQRHGYEYE